LIILADSIRESKIEGILPYLGTIERLIVPEVFEGGDALWYARVAFGRRYVLTDGFKDRASARVGGFVLADDIASGRQRVLR
jgi:hypothetical protein